MITIFSELRNNPLQQGTFIYQIVVPKDSFHNAGFDVIKTSLDNAFINANETRLTPCPHQFFETNLIISYPKCDKTCEETHEDAIHLNDDRGVQVQCALCGQKRKLWQDKWIEIVHN